MQITAYFAHKYFSLCLSINTLNILKVNQRTHSALILQISNKILTLLKGTTPELGQDDGTLIQMGGGDSLFPLTLKVHVWFYEKYSPHLP